MAGWGGGVKGGSGAAVLRANSPPPRLPTLPCLETLLLPPLSLPLLPPCFPPLSSAAAEAAIADAAAASLLPSSHPPSSPVPPLLLPSSPSPSPQVFAYAEDMDLFLATLKYVEASEVGTSTSGGAPPEALSPGQVRAGSRGVGVEVQGGGSLYSRDP